MREGISSQVITANSMQGLEQRAFAREGRQLASSFMEEAGRQLAIKVQAYRQANSQAQSPLSPVYLLCGRGNNGGDAYVCGRHLLAQGLEVIAYQLGPWEGVSPLCQKMALLFQQQGGRQKLWEGATPPDFAAGGLIIDGLLGTGFRGKPRPLCQQMISYANRSKLAILAIDIPSGIDGNEGYHPDGATKQEEGPIHAAQTFYLGFPKLGLFLGQSWDYVGKLTPVSFGLSAEDMASAQVVAELFELETAAKFLPLIRRSRHKYEAGTLAVWAGSPGMGGAAMLACQGALRSGCGLVSLLCTDAWQWELAQAPWEVVKHSFKAKRLWGKKGETLRREWLALLAKSDACLIGPGLGRQEEVAHLLGEIVPALTKPLVLDADALNVFAKQPYSLPSQLVMTPHGGEMARLLHLSNRWENTTAMLTLCQRFADNGPLTLVLKGAPTWVFSPGMRPSVIARGHPGMATAGSGDVLAGIIAALLAQGLTPHAAACLGVFLHALAGEKAGEALTAYSLVASDLLAYLAEAFKSLMAQRPGFSY